MPKAAEANATDKLSFEDALARLEQITKELEAGALTLEKSLEGFEEGIKLIQRCNSLLDSAEKRVKILTASGDGGYAEEDFKTE